MLVAVKVLAKILAKEVLAQLCKLVGIPSVCDKRVSEVTPLKVHYSKHFVTLDKVSGLGKGSSCQMLYTV